MSQPISIKGIRDGLLISLPDGEWNDQLVSLLRRMDENLDFFRGATLVLQVGGRPLTASQLGLLRDQLSGREAQLRAVLTESPITLNAALALGLQTALPGPPPPPDPADLPLDTRLIGEEAVLTMRTLRSGHSLRSPGHVVILGDVNPGAEVVAGGHVIVWGRLRGVVHAGASGDESSMVCALDLAPTQLRIAGQIATSPKRKGHAAPEVARIKNGQLVAEPWE